jgi:plasmid stability protein
MAALTIRKLDESVKSQLRLRAAAHGRSMEEEARQILSAAVNAKPVPPNQGQQIVDAFREAFGSLGGVDLELPSRKTGWTPPTFEE